MAHIAITSISQQTSVEIFIQHLYLADSICRAICDIISECTLRRGAACVSIRHTHTHAGVVSVIHNVYSIHRQILCI